MKLVVQEFLTLDGVSQGPGSPDEDTSDGFTRGGWFAPYVDAEFLEMVGDWLGEADGLLLGRATYQNFARDWPQMTDHPFGGTMNGLPKYVATHASIAAAWNPTTVLSGDVTAQVAELKEAIARLDRVALLGNPLGELALLHGRRKGGHQYLRRHRRILHVGNEGMWTPSNFKPSSSWKYTA